MTPLSPMEEDTLRELLNMGIGRAAASLGSMLGEEILLSVPFLKFMSRIEAISQIQGPFKEPVAAVRQTFGGPFNGSALLIYHEKASLELVRCLLRDDTPLESLTELEQESLLEVGNIILNACLGGIANMLGSELLCDLPEYLKGECAQLLKPVQVSTEPQDLEMCPTGDCVLLLYVDFTTRISSIKGYLVLLLDLYAITRLRHELDHFLDQMSHV